MVENRGKLVLLVDDTQASALESELVTLKEDLVADGWVVLRHDVSPDAEVPDVKAIIKADYDADPDNVKVVYIVGHVPVPYSGNMNPDGHSNHRGAWAADAFYGDMDGTWTDTTVNNTTASRTDNQNVPGDGKYDQSTLPSTLELAVGRVDLNDMPAFSLSETELLRQYLNKAHAFRVTDTKVRHRALVRDRFTGYAEGFSQSGWRLAPLVGRDNVTAGLWEDLITNDYLWAYGCGGGSYTKANGVSTTTVYAVTTYRAAFNMIFGSYFGDWDTTNNFLRAPLGNPTYGLTNAWAGRPNWFFHHMALGETTGLSFRMSTRTIYNYSYQRGGVHIALMGDPALRMTYTEPPSGLAGVSLATPEVMIAWYPASDPDVVGYYIYRSGSLDEPFTKLTESPITETRYTDPYALNGTNVYIVRSLKLEESPSGSYYNLSVGDVVTVSHSVDSQTLHGRVTASGGSPGVSAVTVRACGQHSEPEDGTDSWGYYTIETTPDLFEMHLLKDTGTSLNVTSPASFDWIAATDQGLVENTALDLNLPAFATVTGRVVAKMAGAGGAKIEATATDANSFECYDVAWTESGTFRSAGDFSLTLIPGTYDFTVTAADGTVARRSGVTVSGSTSLSDFDVSNWPGLTRSGQVVNMSGNTSYWATAFNYSTSQSVGSTSGTGDLSLSISVPVDQWLGVYIYDFTDSAYVATLYTYSESLR